jgi:imidazolonepropionase-like amidohydrolase
MSNPEDSGAVEKTGSWSCRWRGATVLLAILAIALALYININHTEAQERVVALVGGAVIDGAGNAPQAGCAVLIQGDRIAAVGPKIQIPKGATVISVAGKTIIPGLVDMHGHMYARATPDMRSQFDSYPLLYLAGGVTTVRSPGDFDPEGMVALRERINRGEATGPRIYTAGPYFDNDPSQVTWIKGVKTPEEALAQFDRWKDRIDYVKFYTRITEPEFRIVVEAARKAGIPTTGHLGSITATRAIELGINGLEHGIFAMSELSKANPQTAQVSRGGACALGDLDLDSPLVENLVASIVKNRVVIDPTVVVFQLSPPIFEPVTSDWLKYLSADAQAHQTKLLSIATATSSSGEGAAAIECQRRSLQSQLGFIKKVHDRGGILTTGTDPVSPRLIPGFGLHRELKNFVAAGLTPVEAIRAATLNAAIALRREKEMGTIQPGKLADLVVIAGDPASRIEDIGKAEMIFKGGVRYDPATLRKFAEGQVK